MKTLEDQLSQYAAYHRDRRNIATHFVGIPLIVLAVAVLLSRPALPVAALAGVPLSPAVAVGLALALYYLWLDRPLGLLMSAWLAATLALGAWAAAQTTTTWLVLGLGGFVVGWVIQFIGHLYEGRKPAFFDDVIGLAIGPLFVLAEALFALGLRPALNQAICQRAGPLRSGRVAADAAKASPNTAVAR
jgi:uncharacterized membrane protein YGL010W